MSEANVGVINITAALLKAQQKIEGVSKDSTNPHFDSKFASLTAVIESVIPVLNEHGIVVIQAPVVPPFEGYLALSTTLIHTSGESLTGTAVLPLQKNDPQGYASALTYARRISLGSFVGLKFKDDDGEAAVGRSTPTPKPASAAPSKFKLGSGTAPKLGVGKPAPAAKAPARGRQGVFPAVGQTDDNGDEGAEGGDDNATE